ncbi:MAG TPA: hypothetical protein H9761_16220 [Candidatus Eisenbergiella merdavium]|uniref:Uncharacterized protein n=1 Tax=Candidatus Eisenbergiella merdavium TaxID=2838551 RepID=A0A9D2NI91_9FIRM|nr:hypothetical protein [Candidatus Eisenbergiella merdavium]
MVQDFIAAFVVVFILLILFFLIARELICWYFKINARLEAQRLTNAYLKEVRDLLIKNNSVTGMLDKEMSGNCYSQTENTSGSPQTAYVDQSQYPDLPSL